MMKSKKSINELKEESEKGDLSASISLALISEMGFYKDADQQEAMKFWERAAQQDDPMAVKCYIHCLENLPEDQQDPKKIDALKDQLKKLGFRSNESLVTRFNEAGALRRVLVVDDDSDFCQLICDSLETLPNIKVAWANRGSLGLRKIVEMKGIELLMVDVNMPEMSGIETLKNIRSNPASEKLPVTSTMTMANSMRSGTPNASPGKCSAGSEAIRPPKNASSLDLGDQIRQHFPAGVDPHRTPV